MVLRKLNSELQSRAVEDLNENPNSIQEDLVHLRDWIQKQPYLTARLDDQFLISFLRGCKWSLQKAKEKVDSFYTIRSMLPELFSNRDPFLSEIQNILEKQIIYPFPNSADSGGYKILYVNLANIDPEKTSLTDLIKFFFMTIDILLNEDDNCVITGLQAIVNYKKVPGAYILQATPGLIKKMIVCITSGYPLRTRECVAINASSLMETLVNTVIKPLLSEKIRHRLYVYNSNDNKNIHQVIDKTVLPYELGGENGSLQEAAVNWKIKVESYRNWFLEDAKFVCNENLRKKKSKIYENCFGIDGTFRKLNID